MSDQTPKHFDSIESRRSTSSRRELGPARRLYYFLGLPVLRAIIRLLTATYRVEKVIGATNIDASKNRMRCDCIRYATEKQRNWLIQWIDNIFNRLGIKN